MIPGWCALSTSRRATPFLFPVSFLRAGSPFRIRKHPALLARIAVGLLTGTISYTGG